MQMGAACPLTGSRVLVPFVWYIWEVMEGIPSWFEVHEFQTSTWDMGHVVLKPDGIHLLHSSKIE